ncbi:hypothetical protein [Pseudomonas sp. CFBP 5750]
MDEFLRLFKTKAPMTIVGVIFIGVVGSAIYDAVVKPGFNIVSKVFFDLITFGSQTVKDYAFSNAALDPTALPSMLIYLSMIAFFVVRMIVINRRVKRRIRLEGTHGSESLTPLQKNFESLDLTDRKKIRRLRYLGWLMDGLMIALLFITTTVMNQSILVWRVYNANEHIIAPYASPNEMLKIKSQFSQIKTEKDYKVLYGAMNAIALKNKVELRSEETW